MSKVYECEMCGSKNVTNGKITQNGKNKISLLKCHNCGHKWKLILPLLKDKK